MIGSRALTELQAHAHTVVDIARTLTAERGDSADAELLTWAEALDAGIASHARDLDMALPWARLVFGNAALIAPATPEQALGLPAVARLFLSFPALADTPDRCETAIHELTTLRARLASDSAAQSDTLTRIDAIIESLARSAAASGALVRRLSTLVQLTQDDVRRDGVRLSLRSDAEALLDRLPRFR